MLPKRGLVVASALMAVHCSGAGSTRPASETVLVAPAQSSALTVEDGGARSTGLARACRGPAEIDAMIAPLARALEGVAPSGWTGTRDDERSIVLVPAGGRSPAATEVERLLDALGPLVAGGALVGSTFLELGGNRPTNRHCRPIVLGDRTRTLQNLCLTTRGDVIEEVRVDVGRRMDVFARLLRISAVEARRVAIAHAEKKLHRDYVRLDGEVLLAECDPSLSAKSLTYRVDLVSDGRADIVEVDATSGAVVGARTVAR